MLNLNRTRKFLLAIILGALILTIAGINNSNAPVYAKTDDNKEVFKPAEDKTTNNDLIEMLNSLKTTIVGIESKVVGIENKINKVDDKNDKTKANTESSKISSKWSAFAKAEKAGENQITSNDASKSKDNANNQSDNEKQHETVSLNNGNSIKNDKKADQTSKNNIEKFRHNISIQKVGQKDREIGVLLINNKKVLAYHNKASNLSPIERTRIVAKRLEKSLDSKGKITDLKPVQSKGIYSAAIKDNIIFSIDSGTAKNTVIGPNNLALAWANNIREAYGASRIKQPGYKDYTVESKRQLAFLNNNIVSRSFNRSANNNTQVADNSPIIQILIPIMPALSKPNGDFSSFINNNNSTGSYTGYASWYGPGFDGRRTSDGSRFNQFSLTAAHKTLPFGTIVKVTNVNNNKVCFVKINDRGPFISGRIIDLSRGAASQIGMLGSGVAKVKVEVIGKMK